VERERLERELRQTGVLLVADAVLDAADLSLAGRSSLERGERSLKHRVEDGDDVSVARGLPSWSTQAHLAIDALGAVAVAATPF
jgi:hypothetical protein